MSYKGQVLRGEKWFHLMESKDMNENQKADVGVYLDSQKKVKEKVEVKSKGEK